MSAQLEARTKTFALDVVCFCAALPHAPEIGHIRGQLHRSAVWGRIIMNEHGKVGDRRVPVAVAAQKPA